MLPGVIQRMLYFNLYLYFMQIQYLYFNNNNNIKVGNIIFLSVAT